jgi:hypothetical protein
MTDEQASHREYSFAPKRTIIDRSTGQPVYVGSGQCTCGWTTTGRDDECMRQYAEHVAAESAGDQAQ